MLTCLHWNCHDYTPVHPICQTRMQYVHTSPRCRHCNTYILLPGVGTVLRNRALKSTILEARMVNSEWGCSQSFKTFPVKSSSTTNSHSESEANLTRSIVQQTSIGHSHGSANMSLPIQGDNTCRNGCNYIYCQMWLFQKMQNRYITSLGKTLLADLVGNLGQGLHQLTGEPRSH